MWINPSPTQLLFWILNLESDWNRLLSHTCIHNFWFNKCSTICQLSQTLWSQGSKTHTFGPISGTPKSGPFGSTRPWSRILPSYPIGLKEIHDYSMCSQLCNHWIQHSPHPTLCPRVPKHTLLDPFLGPPNLDLFGSTRPWSRILPSYPIGLKEVLDYSMCSQLRNRRTQHSP